MVWGFGESSKLFSILRPPICVALFYCFSHLVCEGDNSVYFPLRVMGLAGKLPEWGLDMI
jgi:hypothetical protein